MKITTFHKPMMRAAVLAICTATLSTMPMLVAQDNAAPPPPSQQQNNMGPGGPGGRGSGRHVERLTQQLNLTPDQVTQVKAIEADTMSQMKALRDQTSTAQADRRSKMMEIRQASQDKIRNVLNDEQKTKFDAMQARMKARRQNRQGGPGAMPPPPPAVQQ